MRKLLAVAGVLIGATSLALAQQHQPAQLSVTPSTTPQTLQVLEPTGDWQSIGWFPSTGNFTFGVVNPQSGVLPTLVPGGIGFIPLGFSSYIPSDNSSQSGVTGGTALPVAINSTYFCCGPAVNNGRNGINSFFYFNTASSPSNPYKYYVANNAYISAAVSDHGTVGGDSTSNGVFEGLTSQAYLKAPATSSSPAYFGSVFGGEFSVAVSQYNDVKIKALLATTEWPTDQQSGDWVDAHIWAAANTGAIGLMDWAVIDGSGGGAPLKATGEIMKVQNSPQFTTIQTGLNFTNMIITGNVLQWGNGAWFLGGNGNASFDFLQTQLTKLDVTYAVADLPLCASNSAGVSAYVSNAKATGWNIAVTGGGTLHIRVLCNGSNWMSD